MMLRIAYFGVWVFFGVALFSSALIWDATGVRISVGAVAMTLLSAVVISVKHFERQSGWLSRAKDAAYVGYTLLFLFLLAIGFNTSNFQEWDWRVLLQFEPALLGAMGTVLMAVAFVVRHWDGRPSNGTAGQSEVRGRDGAAHD